MQVYCYYDGSREIAPGYKKSVFDEKPFGVHMDVAALMAKQVRIERQEEAVVSTVSFDRFAANAFQEYVQAALGFSIQRCGVLYGRVEEGGEVFVDVIYEPQQSGQSDRVSIDLQTDEAST